MGHPVEEERSSGKQKGQAKEPERRVWFERNFKRQVEKSYGDCSPNSFSRRPDETRDTIEIEAYRCTCKQNLTFPP